MIMTPSTSPRARQGRARSLSRQGSSGFLNHSAVVVESCYEPAMVEVTSMEVPRYELWCVVWGCFVHMCVVCGVYVLCVVVCVVNVLCCECAVLCVYDVCM